MKRRSNYLLFWALGVYVLLYLPIVVMAANSFNRSKYPYHWGGFTFHWYGELLQNEEVLGAFWSSLWIGGVSTFLAVILGTAAAMALRSKTKDSKGKWIEPLLMLPVILPDIVLGISLLLFFVFIRMALGPTTIILAHVTFSMVYVFLVVRVRLKGLDPALEEAAQDLGANPITTFRRVTFPLIFPGVLAGALLAFSLSFEDFLITFFTAGVGTTTLPLQIYSMMKFGVSPVISALSTAFLVLTVLATLVVQRRWME